MARQNPYIAEPKSPGEWVDSGECYGCGGIYDRFRTFPSVSFVLAREELFQLYESGGKYTDLYIGRGTVLWWLRCRKLQCWYEEHLDCGGLYYAAESAANDHCKSIPMSGKLSGVAGTSPG